MPKKEKRSTISKGIRFPDEVKERIEALAAAEHRDFTKQVLHLVAIALEQESRETESSSAAANPREKLA